MDIILGHDEIKNFILTDPEGATNLIIDMFNEEIIPNQTIKELKARNEELETRNKELEARLNQNSQNSNFPSSRDLYNLKCDPKSNSEKKENRRTTSLRQKSDRKVGGQKNHPRKTLQQSSNPDEISYREVKTCTCGNDLRNVKPQKYIKRQLFEIPKIIINVTEYNAEVKLCPCCGHKNIAEFPENITQNVQYGENLKTFAIYTKNQVFTSYDKLKTEFLDLAGQSLSPATLIGFEKQAYLDLEKFEEEVKAELIRSPVLNADETSLKVISERWWLHSIGNDHLTCYMAHHRRGSIAIDEMGVFPQYEGVRQEAVSKIAEQSAILSV